MSESGNSENILKRAWFIKPLKSVRSKGKQRKGAQAAKLDKREAGKSYGIRMTCLFIILPNAMSDVTRCHKSVI